MSVSFPERAAIDAALVRRLLREQFPAWAELPVRPVDHLWKGLIMLTNLTPGESDFARRVLQELLGPE